MRPKLLLLMSLCCALNLSACNPESQDTESSAPPAETETNAKAVQSPQTVVKQFLDSYLIQRDIAGAYQYFSQADRQAKSQAEYVKEKTQPGLEEMYKKSNRYTITQSEIGAEKASFTFELKTVDFQKLFATAMGDKSLLELAAMKPEEASRLTEQNLAKYQQGKEPVPMTTQSQTVELIQEDGEWRVQAGWAAEAKQKQAQNPVLGIAGQGVLMSDPGKGQVLLKVNSVRFTTTKAKPGMALCIVKVTVSNAMKEQFTETFGVPLASAEIYAQGGNKYNRELGIYDPALLKDVDIVNPLNPGKTITGDIAFQVDKAAKDLKLSFDAGYSPLPKSSDYSEGKSLSFKLGDVSL